MIRWNGVLSFIVCGRTVCVAVTYIETFSNDVLISKELPYTTSDLTVSPPYPKTPQTSRQPKDDTVHHRVLLGRLIAASDSVACLSTENGIPQFWKGWPDELWRSR